MTDNDVLKAILDELRSLRKFLEDRPSLPPEAPSTPYPHTPVQPYLPGVVPDYTLPERCSRCGIPLQGVMGYVCQNPRCPTGLGPTIT